MRVGIGRFRTALILFVCYTPSVSTVLIFSLFVVESSAVQLTEWSCVFIVDHFSAIQIIIKKIFKLCF